jgi:hypothetical protein
MQRVQRVILTTLPSLMILACWMLATQRWLVRRFEWLTLWPNCSDFPQISHFIKLPFSFDWSITFGVKCLVSNTEYYHKAPVLDKQGTINMDILKGMA